MAIFRQFELLNGLDIVYIDSMCALAENSLKRFTVKYIVSLKHTTDLYEIYKLQ